MQKQLMIPVNRPRGRYVTGVYICSFYSILTGCYDNRVRIWRHDGKCEHTCWMHVHIQYRKSLCWQEYEYRPQSHLPPNRFCSECPTPYHWVGGMGGGGGTRDTWEVGGGRKGVGSNKSYSW